MSAVEPVEDGALQPALQLLEDAIHRLCGPQSRMIDDALVYIPSRYLSLMDSVAGEQVNAGTGGGSKSRPPMWLDAHDLLHEIDVACEIWQPAYTGTPPTVGRLHWIAQRRWRPQDTRQIEQIARAVAEWAQSIDELLDPPRRWTLPSPCPACNTAVVYKKDSAGEPVRSPALQVDTTGCRCAKCRAVWPPEKFAWLANVLGYEPPEGVVDTP